MSLVAALPDAESATLTKATAFDLFSAEWNLQPSFNIHHEANKLYHIICIGVSCKD